MNIRTFQGESMADALKQVKRELGGEAVILHTRTFRRGGVFGFGAKRVVEVTASAEVSIVPPKMRRHALSDGRAGSMPAAEPAPPRGAAGVLRQAYRMNVDVESAGARAPGVNGNGHAGGGAVAVAEAPDLHASTRDSKAAQQQITDEIRQIRRMVCRMMRDQTAAPPADMPDQLFNEYLALLEQEVTEELAEEVVRNVRAKLKPEDVSDKRKIRRAIGAQLAKLIPTDTAAANKSATSKKPDDGRPLTIALIGPTGVGKTTTVAKLAATFKLRENKRVALVTVDTYRIAAVDQLQTYANIISLPLEVVSSPEDLGAALKRLSGYDVVLIDTAGRSQRDDSRLTELRRFIDAADPHEVHLVLSSTCSQAVLDEAVDRFSQVRMDRIIFTKLDEAVSFGVLLNVVRRVNKQLSYVTTGQEVPHQIEPGRSDRLAQLILGGGV